jgi:hypothetical protein
MAEEYQEIRVGNEILRFPAEMSEEEIAKVIQGDASIQAQLADDAIEYEEGLYTGKMKAGVTASLSFFEAVAENPIWSKIYKDMTTVGGTGELDAPGSVKAMGTQFTQDFEENEMKWAERTADFFGWDQYDINLLPKDQIEATLATGAYMMTDPLVLASKAKSVGEFVLKIPYSMAQWAGIGATSSVAATQAGNLEEMATGEDSGVLSTIAGVSSAILTGKYTQPVVNTLASKTKDLLSGKGFKNEASLIKSTIETQSQKFAHANIKNILKEASKAGSKDVEIIMQDFAKISHYFDDVDIPFFLAMSDNPVIAGELNKLIRKNPSVRAQVEDEITKIVNAIEGKANRMFGVPIVGKSLEEAIPTSVVRTELWYRLDNLKTNMAKTQDKIDELGANYLPASTMAQRGKEIEALVKLKKEQARKIRELEYSAILKSARKNNIKMPAQGVEQIWRFVDSLQLQNKFGAGTVLESKIRTLLRPTVKTTKTKNAAGKIVTTRTETFKQMTFDDVNSLKKEINKQLRRNPSADTVNMLEDLKAVLDDARTTIPGTYSSALKLADENYYTHIGLPFGEQGIKEISSAKYAQQIAPVVVQNAESLNQFYNVVGREKGVDIAKNAFLAEVYEKSVINGQLQPKLLQSLIKKKSEVIDLIPGLRDELNQSVNTQGYLSDRINTLNEVWKSQEKKIGDHFLLKAGGVEGYQPSEVVNRMVNNREYMSKIIADVDRLPKNVQGPIRNTIRREFVEQLQAIGAKQGKSSFDWLIDPENAYTIQKIMGKGFQNDMRAFARLSDKINKLSPEKVANMPTNPLYDVVQAKTGVDLPSIVSLIRRPIISPQQKAVILASRIWTGGRMSRADKQMQDILFSDLKGIEEFYKLEKLAKKTNMSDEVLLSKYTDILVNIAPRYFMAVEGDVKRDAIQQDLEEQQIRYQSGI